MSSVMTLVGLEGYKLVGSTIVKVDVKAVAPITSHRHY